MSIYKVASKVIKESEEVFSRNVMPSKRDDLLINIALAAQVLAKEVLKGTPNNTEDEAKYEGTE